MEQKNRNEFDADPFDSGNLKRIMKKNKTILFGMAISIVVNLIFFLKNFTKPMDRLQYEVCFFLPMITAVFLCGITFFIKMILRGEIPFEKWDYLQAQHILQEKNTFFRKFLARLFLTIYKPSLFSGGWMVGCCVFIFFAKPFLK